MMFSADYLPTKEHVQQLIDAAKNYISHIDNDDVTAYNKWKSSRYNLETKQQSKNSKQTKKERSKTFIYVMHNKLNGFYKIGRSNNPIYRENTLQAQEPEIDMLFNIEGTLEDETKLHQIFKDKRIRGEWFSLNDDDIQFIRNYK